MEFINWLSSEEGIAALTYIIPIAMVLALPLTLIARRLLFKSHCGEE